MSETRALTAALSGPAFDGAASRSALHTSERHAERYAPEGAGARREGGLRSLAFADRVASPWMAAANQSRATQMFSSYANGTGERSVPGVSWLFPRPWFQDELDWMAAAREGLETTPRGSLSTRGTYLPSPSSSEFAPTAFETARGQAWSNVAMPVLSPDVMATVAPSMRGSAGQRAADPSAPMQRNLRAWSPTVDFAAAAAAEVMMGAMSSVAAAGLPAIAERSPIWSGLAVVTPNALAGEASPFTAPRASAFVGSTPAAPSLTAAPSSFAPSSFAPSIVAAPTAVDSARDSIGRIEGRIEELRHPEAAAAAAASAAASPSVDAPIAAPLSSGEQQLATAARSSSAVAQALRTVELLLGAAAPQRAAWSPSASAPSATPSYDASGAPIAAEPSTMSAPMPQHFAPIAGPRVTMPAGLGGLVTSLETSRTIARPMSRAAADESMFSTPMIAGPSFAGAPTFIAAPAADAPGRELGSTSAAAARGAMFSPVWAQAPSAFASVASHGARAVDHLSWSDRWLARFAGASPLALSAFDATRAVAEPTLRPMTVGSPEIVYIQPQLTTRAVAGAGWSARAQQAPSEDARPRTAAAPAPTGALRIDDDAAVSDDIFAAIAAASASPSPRAAQRLIPTPVAAATPAEQARLAELSAELTATRAAQAAIAPSVMAPVDLLRASGRTSVADLVSIAVPAAPDAGVSAGLASSPMAPALASLLPLPNAPVFDPRALQGAGLSEAYLGGFLARAALPVGVIAGAPTASALAAASAPMIGANAVAMEAWTRRDLALAPAAMRLASSAPDREFIATGGDVDVPMRGGRGAAELFAPTAQAAAAQQVAVAQQVAAQQAAAQQAAIARSTAPDMIPIAGEPTPTATPAPARAALEAELVALRSALLAGPDASSVPLAHAEYAPLMASMAAVPSASHAQIPSLGGVVQGASSPMATALARSAMASFAQPGDAPMPAAAAAAQGAMHAPTIAAAGGRPGSLAEATLAWSINEERAAASLAFDFVTPELILAAKVYGLPPGAAAEAMRIASAGPSAMSSLATSLDLTFLRAFQSSPAAAARGAEGLTGSAMAGFAPSMPAVGATFAAPGQRAAAPVAGTPAYEAAIAAERAASSGSAASPSASAPFVAGDAPAAAPEAAAAWASAVTTPEAFAEASAAPASAPARLPRGAFLWPAGSVAAMGLRALSSEGYAGLPVVALELLAAQAVAELGTWVTAYPGAAQPGARAGGFSPYADAFTPGGFAPAGFEPGTAGLPFVTTPGARDQQGAVVDAAGRPVPSYAAQVAAAQRAGGAAPDAAAADVPEEAADAAAWFTSALGGDVAPARARFESVYIALAQSPEGQSLSPSARAARAMSLLARSDDSQRLSTRERAQAAWSMLPGVYSGNMDVIAGEQRARGDASSEILLDKRPGLAGLAARAGDALGSFVHPSAEAVHGLSQSGDMASPSQAAARAALPIYVDNSRAEAPQSISAPRAGRAYSQVGGGETEIPSWFESAARRMFDDGGGKGDVAMTMAQMVLVTAMPQQQVAAATKGASSGGSGAPGAAGGKGAGGVDKPDVDQLALEVFHEVMKLIEIARERSGDPFQ